MSHKYYTQSISDFFGFKNLSSSGYFFFLTRPSPFANKISIMPLISSSFSNFLSKKKINILS